MEVSQTHRSIDPKTAPSGGQGGNYCSEEGLLERPSHCGVSVRKWRIQDSNTRLGVHMQFPSLHTALPICSGSEQHFLVFGSSRNDNIIDVSCKIWETEREGPVIRTLE